MYNNQTSDNPLQPSLKSTTILAVIHDGVLAIGGDGQATLGNTVAKSNVNKIHELRGNILTGFAGATADAFTLLEEFEKKLNAHANDMKRAALELVKSWRTERFLRKLEAMIILANKEKILILSGAGDVLEPNEPVAAIGSGGVYALSAALALRKFAPKLSAEEIVRESLHIAADICIYTNHNIVLKTLS
ncbi:MAG: ATP-dependent protease subunit HslV [Bacteroidota bacterium]